MKRFVPTTLVAVALVAATSLISSFSVAETPVPGKPENPDAKKSTEPPQVEVCFVLDTTGSMAGLIQGAKDKIWSIANELASAKPTPNIKFGLIGYRDRGDAYITKVFDLTNDLDAIHGHLMKFEAAEGGDGPESVNQALHESVAKMSWSEGRRVLRIVFLVGDAPPHMDYENDIHYPEVCKLAMKKGLIINTIQCGSVTSTTPIWKEIALKSEGQFTAIQQSGGTVAISTPYDKDIADVNGKLNGTIVGYGDVSVQKSVEEKVATNAAAPMEAVADRAGYFSKLRGKGGAGGGKVIGGSNDLVEQLIQKKIKIEDIDSAKLPEDLKKLSREEQLAAIQTRVDERLKLQESIDKLVKKRSAHIAKEKERMAEEGEVDSFDLEVKEIIKAQGAKKGIDFDTSGE